MMYKRRLLLGLVCGAHIGAPASADVVTLVTAKDNTLYENAAGTTSNGAGEFFFVGRTNQFSNFRRRGLIAFDIAGNIPAGSTINSAQLTLHLSRRAIFGAVAQTVELHRLLADWGEGTSNALGAEGSGAVATTGDATWIHTFFNTNFWTNAGANGDFSATVSASTVVDLVAFYTWGSTAEMVADVQMWLDTPLSNFGWILTGNEGTQKTARRFDTRENLTAANRPMLTIDFTPPVFIGACCDDLPGVCEEGVELSVCAASGRRFGGDGSDCATINPPCLPSGACCDDATGNCTDLVTQNECEIVLGFRYGGDASTCASINPPCVPPPAIGACCDDLTGVCTEAVEEDVCLASGRRFGGDGSTCATIDPPCLPPPPPIEISLEVVAEGLTAPVFATHAGDGSGRLFIVDQAGLIRIVDAGDNLLPTPFLDLTAQIVTVDPGFDERGVLGLAFHPDYAINGRFFVRYSAERTGVMGEPCFGTPRGCHKEVLAEFKQCIFCPSDPNIADPNSEIILFEVDEPQFNHNAGQVAFGPDGLLYFTLGDGGGANDSLDDPSLPHGPDGNGQNPFTTLGSLLRIDVGAGAVLPDDFPADPNRNYAIPPGNPFADGVQGAPEVFAYGLRNPYRFSFDDGPGGGGSLFLSDVGQDLFEEVNVLPLPVPSDFVELAKLTAADGAAFDQFGWCVAVSGDTAVVGAPQFQPPAVTGSGSAYVFEKIGGVWTQTAKLTASDAAPNDQFGVACSISGDVAVVGAHVDEPGQGGNINSGSAYVFEKIGGVWMQTAKLTASDAAGGDNFGLPVSISADSTIVVGAIKDDCAAGIDCGSAYVFERGENGVWDNGSVDQVAKLTAADGAAGDLFGAFVAVSGETTAIVGAPGQDKLGVDAGAAYVFEKVVGVWTQTAKLTAADGAAGDQFGNSCSISGDGAVIGAILDDDGGDKSGSAYVFVKPPGGWNSIASPINESAKLTASDAAANDAFGASVSISGDRVVVGATSTDDAGVDSGSAYKFVKPPGGWMDMTETQKLTALDASAGDYFGESVSISDISILVGADGDDSLGDRSGSAYVFERSPALLNYGWAVREGFNCFNPFNPGMPPLMCTNIGPLGETMIDPVLEYDHSVGLAVIGGFVYRGSAVPPLVGKYVFGDFSQDFGPTGQLFYTDIEGPQAFVRREFIIQSITATGVSPRYLAITAPDSIPLGQALFGIGEDEAGELYVCSSDNIGPTGNTGIVSRIVPPITGPNPFGLVVTPSCPGGVSKHVGAPSGPPDNIALLVDNPLNGAFLTADAWGGTVRVTDVDVVPSDDLVLDPSEYNVQLDTGTPGAPALSAAVTATTSLWGDVVGVFDGEAMEWTPPNGIVNILDVLAIVDRFLTVSTAPALYRADLVGVSPQGIGCLPDQVVNILDVLSAVDGFLQLSFAEATGCAVPCP